MELFQSEFLNHCACSPSKHWVELLWDVIDSVFDLSLPKFQHYVRVCFAIWIRRVQVEGLNMHKSVK